MLLIRAHFELHPFAWLIVHTLVGGWLVRHTVAPRHDGLCFGGHQLHTLRGLCEVVLIRPAHGASLALVVLGRVVHPSFHVSFTTVVSATRLTGWHSFHGSKLGRIASDARGVPRDVAKGAFRAKSALGHSYGRAVPARHARHAAALPRHGVEGPLLAAQAQTILGELAGGTLLAHTVLLWAFGAHTVREWDTTPTGWAWLAGALILRGLLAQRALRALGLVAAWIEVQAALTLVVGAAPLATCASPHQPRRTRLALLGF